MSDDILKQNIWTVEEKHSVGVSDPKISKVWVLAKEITKHLEIKESEKDEADFFADRLLDKLESALMYYQLIEAKDFNERNISQKRTIYEGLYANLWSFYKGRMQNYLEKIGWKIGFFFCKEKSFEKLAENFIKQNPEHSILVEMARKQRELWQTDFGMSRDSSEHNGDYRHGIATYESKKDAREFFARVCWSAETLIAYCGSYSMTRDWNIVEERPNASIFDMEDRYVVEHAIQSIQRGMSTK
jgi:hypothetical protein